jgi:hypothetical protein
VKKLLKIVFSWLYVFIIKVNRTYKKNSLSLLRTSMVTLGTPQLRNPKCEPSLEGVILKPKPCPGFVHVDKVTFFSVESNPLNLV